MTAIVVTPLALLAGGFYAARTLDEPWSTLTRLHPIYYLVDVTRSLITGFSESAVGVSLAFAALAAVATSRCVVGWVGTVDDEPTLA
jgi:ABC-type polysaccharide/polyol phosphate export permease